MRMITAVAIVVAVSRAVAVHRVKGEIDTSVRDKDKDKGHVI